ncbi:MAG: hypothetical protein Q7T74_03575 [Candidatus Saccharibacteria bacterium]|nr:hypothetical protein [Candidatus Saccharibacteria bacterium]
MHTAIHKPLGQFEPQLEGFRICVGPGVDWNGSATFRDQIIENSRQPHIFDFAPDDAARRFKDVESLALWAEEGKVVFCLSDASMSLAGLAWFGKRTNEHAPGLDTTFAIRMYEGFVGRGLAAPFMRMVHDNVGTYLNVSSGTWIETAATNTRSMELFQDFGYVPVHSAERVVMQYHEQ